MRIVLNPAYAAFNATAGTITFSTVIPASLSHILRVINLTRQVVYFDPTAENGGGYLATATYAAPVLTLQGIDTRSHANGDRLFIEFDDGTSGGGGGGGAGGGDASAANQTLQLNELQAINADLGAPDDAPAASPTATAGIGALIRLGLQGLATGLTNWTTLLSRVPTLTVTSGRLQVSTGMDQALTDAQLRATAVPVSGPLTDVQLRAASVPVTTTASATDAIGTGTRQYDWSNGLRQAIASTSSAAVAIPTLGTSREVMFHANTRCFVRFGTSGVADAAVAAGHMVLESGERFHHRVAAGVTHFKVIRDTADGFINVTAVL